MPLQLWVSAAEIGCFFALIGLGYLVVLNGAGFFNFALGPYAMFSALCSSYLVVVQHWQLWQGVLVGVACAVILSLITEIAVVRPIERRAGGEELIALIAVVAVLFAVGQLAGTLFGRRPLPGRAWLELPQPLQVGDASIGGQTVLLVAATLLTFLLLSLWLRGARYGQWLRAVGDNQTAARMLGFPVARVRLVAFGVSGMIAGLAGPLFSPKAGISFDSGLNYSLFGFLALVIGGTGSVWAPLVGGLVLAALQIFSSFFLGGAWLNYATLIAALLFFAFRPEGIFARRIRH